METTGPHAASPRRKLSLNAATAVSPVSGGRKPSLTSAALTAYASGPQRKQSHTAAVMADAAIVPQPPAATRERNPSLSSPPPRKPSTASAAVAAVSQRKPSLTTAPASQNASVGATGVGPATLPSSRDRKPSFASPRDRNPSLTGFGSKQSADRLTSVGMAAFATTSSGGSSRQHGVPTPTPPDTNTRAPGKRSSQQQQQQQLLTMKATRRSFSSSASDQLLIDIFFHVPAYKELQRLRVHRTLTLIGLQAMVQREFHIPFEDQRIYWHGDLLEGDEDLVFYDIHDQSVLNVRVRKRYRPIGDVFTKIKTVRFVSAARPEDYEIVEIVASLPPTHVLFKRLVTAISYLQRLDMMQFGRTRRRVWKQRVSFWEEPSSISNRRGSAAELQVQPRRPSELARSEDVSESIPDTLSLQQPAVASSFVMLHSGPERVSYVVSLSQTHAIPQRLQLAPENRSQSDVRHIKKWLSSIKYFASASLPDSAIHDVARACIYVKYAAGDFIFRQGDVGDHFYIVISGCVSLAAYGNGFFATMTPGRCFGEISLFEGQGGFRTASANANFAFPYAELAVLSGDIYRRVINPYKQAVLQHTEKAIYSIPQLRSLPDHIITHIAYASKKLEARHGKLLVRHGEELNVLVLLVRGEVKVSITSKSVTAAGSDNEAAAVIHPVVSVIRAPAVFCQEVCLSNTPSAAPWDIEALDNCTLLCLPADTISVFLSPRQDIIRALNREHAQRIQDFQRRFGHSGSTKDAVHFLAKGESSSTSRQAAAMAKLSKMKLLSAKLFESQRLLHLPQRGRRGALATHIQFPKVLLRRPEVDEDEAPRLTTRPGRGSTEPQQKQTTSTLSCAELQDEFLQKSLPFSEVLNLRNQVRYCGFSTYELDEEDKRGRTRALLQGLRQLPVEDVEMMPQEETRDRDAVHYYFSCRLPTSPSSMPTRRVLHTR